MMRRFLLTLLVAGCLAGCSGYRLPPFAQAGLWQRQGNAVLNAAGDVRIDFAEPGALLANASNGDYELNFVVSQADFDRYDAAWAKYLTDVLRAIPLRIDSIDLILADQYAVLSTNAINAWRPDYVRRADGAWLVAQANPTASSVQPHDELWRILVFDSKKHQIVVVDRMVKRGHHYAIVYVMQSERKGIRHRTRFHYDILDRRNVQAVGTHLEYLLGISVNAMNSRVE